MYILILCLSLKDIFYYIFVMTIKGQQSNNNNMKKQSNCSSIFFVTMSDNKQYSKQQYLRISVKIDINIYIRLYN